MGCYRTNCRQSVPRVVRGNDFTAMVLVTRRVPSDGGDGTEPVELSRCTGITARRVTRLGRRTEMGFSVDGSYLVVPFDDELPSGSYGFEATGKYANGRDWALRLMPGEFVDIVEPSSAGYADGATERDVYEFSAVVLGESMSEAQMDRMNAAIETANAAAKEAAELAAEAVAGEAERKANEAGRVAAERRRQEEFEANESAWREAEAERARAEEGRQAAEAGRQAAEKLREDNVSDVRERVGTLEDNAARYAKAEGDTTARLLGKDGKDIYPKLIADSLPTGGVTRDKLADGVVASLDEAQARIAGLETKAAALGDRVDTLDGDETVEGSVRKRVKDAVSSLVGSAPDTLDTLQKIAEEMRDPGKGAAVTVLDQVAGKADKGTTLAEYGIGDAYTKAEADALLADKVGSTDPRLSDARPASDVQAWAKAAGKPAYTKEEVGLGNVDDTSDADKPISAATQAALDGKVDKMVPTTHAELVRMMDGGTLVPGTQYRITDYVPIFNEGKWGISGGPGQFDVIVTADAPDSVSEAARATWHEGDTYYERQNLDVWRVWYCPHNDYQLFPWCDYYRSKGVIYRLIDESGNDVPYDFKGMRFDPACTLFGDGSDLGSLLGVTRPVPTFWTGDGDTDASLFTDDDTSVPRAADNVVEALHASREHVAAEDVFARNIFVVGLKGFDGGHANPANNRLGAGSAGNIVCGTRVTMGKECLGNVVGGLGSQLFACHDVTMGDRCEGNRFRGDSIGDNVEYCHHVSLGNDCKDNDFTRSEHLVLGDGVEYVKANARHHVYVMPGVKALAENGMTSPVTPRGIGDERDWEVIAHADGVGGETYSFTCSRLARMMDDGVTYSVVEEITD